MNIFEKIAPFITLGVALAIAIGLFFLMFYVVVWGIVIGLCLYAVGAIMQFFRKKKAPSVQSQGRIIEHDEIR